MKPKTSQPAQDGKKQAKIDPELLRQIDTLAADEAPLQAVLMLRPSDPSKLAAPPERTEELTNQVLHRVEEQTGKKAERVNVFRYLGSFAISASKDFLSELLKQPEIASAVANKTQGEAYIAPHDVAPVTEDTKRGWSTPEPEKKKSAVRSKSGGSASAGKSQKTTRSVKSARSGKSSK